MRARTATLLAIASLAGLASAGCEGGRSEYGTVTIQGGDPHRGRLAIEAVGCGACHLIPGIRDAEGLVGPPLIKWSRRTYIAGSMPNVPRNLTAWVGNAHTLRPDGAMPNLDLTEQQARDVAAYLYTLE